MAQPMQAVQATAAPENWKTNLKLPPKDPRFRTEVGAALIPWVSFYFICCSAWPCRPRTACNGFEAATLHNCEGDAFPA